MQRTASWALVWGWLLLAPSAVAADGPLTASVKAGGKPRAVSVSVVVEAGQAVLVADGAREALPLRDPTELTAESVEGPQGAIGIVRASNAAGGKAGAVIVRGRDGKTRFAFVGPLDPRGDPGERTWSSIDVIGDAGSAQRTVVVAQHHERVAVCGEPAAHVQARSVAPSGELRPFAVARLNAARAITEVAAQSESKSFAGPPKLRAFQVRGVSSLAGSEAPWLGSPVNALSDGDMTSAWVTRPEHGGRGEFATAAIDTAGLPVRAIALVVGDGGQKARLPKSLWLVSDSGPVLHVALPQPSAAGKRYWIELAQPLATRCLSVVIDDAGSAAGETASAGLAELELFTELDAAGGLAQLVKDVAGSGAPAARASDVLKRMGPAVIAPLVEASAAMPPSARARVARIWSAYASTREARAALATALGDPDAAVREVAIEGLARGGAEAHALLAARVATDGPVGDDAAVALARSAPLEALPVIASALAAGSERPRLREALAIACDRGSAMCVEQLRAWASATPVPDVRARAAMALALVGLDQASVAALVAELIASSYASAERFEDLWRLVVAAKDAGPNAAIDAWLAELVAHDERWMVRAAALQALTERKADAAIAAARTALDDKYPRVRLAAVAALKSDSASAKGLTTHAQRDRWPMVRAAAYETLAFHPGSGEALKAGVADGSKVVRAAALRALATAKVASAWPLVEARLRNDNEWPEVKVAGLELVRALCIQDARDAVVTLLVRTLQPDAADFELELAQPAFETLVQLGGEAKADALKVAARKSAPAGLKALAQRAKAASSACPPSASQKAVSTPATAPVTPPDSAALPAASTPKPQP